MGYGRCSTGRHISWISVGGFRSFPCECPPVDWTPFWGIDTKPEPRDHRKKAKRCR